MKIGVMLRDFWNQTDAPGIIVLNLMNKILNYDKRNEYVLFFRDDRFIDYYNKFENARGVAVSAPNKLIWDQLAVPWAARKEKVDLIFHPKHSIPLLTSKKTVMQLRGAEYWTHPEYFEWHDLLYSKLFIPLYCRKSTRIITESNDVNDDFVKHIGIPKAKTRMVYLACNERFSVIDDKEILTACKKKYNLPDKFILTVTRVLQNNIPYAGKNILRSIEAFRHSDTRKIMKFVIIGRKVSDFIQKNIAANDEILTDLIILDALSQEELPAIYNSAVLFLFPSNYESFGIPILEAMSCGLPVITSKTYSCPEISGDAGLHVAPDVITEITAAIDTLASDKSLQKKMRQKGLVRSTEFSWDMSAKQTIEIFDGIARE